MSTRKIIAAGVISAVASVAVPGAAQAVEGTVQYPHGAEGFMAGALPPPGTYFLGYGIHYQGTYHDGDGNTVQAGGEDVELRVDGFAARVVHMTDWTILGGQYGVQAIVPVFNNELDAGGRSFVETGLGDITLDPAIIAWHRDTLHWVVGLDVILPTGAFDRTKPLNLGANYWSFEPLLAVTWLPGDGWEVNAKFMYNIKLENPDTDVQSGDEVHIDYAVGKTFGDWTAGLGGYGVYQVTDDEQNGQEMDNKARVFSVGPMVKYQAGATSLIAKWQHEVVAENAFKGNRFILKLVTPF